MNTANSNNQRHSSPPLVTHATYPPGEHPAEPAPLPAPFWAETSTPPPAATATAALPPRRGPRSWLVAAAVIAASAATATAAALLAYSAGSSASEAAVVTETVTETRIEYVETEPDRWQSCEDLALLQGWDYQEAEDLGTMFNDADGYDTSGVGYTPGEGCAVLWAGLIGAGE